MEKTFWAKKKTEVKEGLIRIERYCARCGETIEPMSDPYKFRYCPYCGAETDRELEDTSCAYPGAGVSRKDAFPENGVLKISREEETMDDKKMTVETEIQKKDETEKAVRRTVAEYEEALMQSRLQMAKQAAKDRERASFDIS